MIENIPLGVKNSGSSTGLAMSFSNTTGSSIMLATPQAGCEISSRQIR